MKIVGVILAFVFLAYLFICISLYFFQANYIFFPPKANEPWYAKIKPYEYFLKTDSAVLHGWKVSNLHTPHTASIIYFGGNAEDVSHNIPDAHLYSVRHLFLTNLPGFGASSGTPSEKNFYSNALQVYDQIVESSNLNPDNVFIMGRSLGSAVATYVASKRKVRGLIIITPFDSIENVASHYYNLFPVKRLLKHKFQTEAYIDEVNAPIVALTADHDGVIPAENLANLYTPRKQKINLLQIQGSDHNTISHSEQYFSFINGFILANTVNEN